MLTSASYARFQEAPDPAPRDLRAAPTPFTVKLDEFLIYSDSGKDMFALIGEAEFLAHADGEWTLQAIAAEGFTVGPALCITSRPHGCCLETIIWDQVNERAVYECMDDEEWEELGLEVGVPERRPAR